MGRQYNFYMGRKDEELFLEYLKQNQYVVYQDDKSFCQQIILLKFVSVLHPQTLLCTKSGVEMRENMDDLFKKLYDYIEPFDADWKKRLKPASKKLITRFIETSRIGEYASRIPLSYFQFLEKMGKDDGGLLSNLKGGGTINPKELMNEIKNCWYFDYEKDFIALKKFPFFMDCIGGAPIYFDLSTEDNKGIWKGFDNIERVSESFEKLLFQCAFDWFVEYEFKNSYSRSLYGKGEYQKIIQVVESYGIKETWFSDPNEYRGEGENIAFSMKYYKPDGICGKITSQDERGRRIVEELLLY